jgi:NAD(P)-dependent dehydrogenase (short-subunit alcohol dehydrogenase family)
MNSFADKVAFITGGANGMGLAIGRALSAKGASVVLADIDEVRLTQAADAMSEPVETIVLDVRDRPGWADAKNRTEARLGPVSLLFNNAGIINDAGGPISRRGLTDQTPESFDRMIGVNLTGVFNGITTFAPGMRERGQGHIVNTASTQGVVSCQGVGSYCAAKFGVVSMTESLRDELAPAGIGVSVLCPGPVQTRISSSSSQITGDDPADIPPDIFLSADTVAQMVLAAIIANEPYIFTHGEYLRAVKDRHRAIEAALAATPVSPMFDPGSPVGGTREWAQAMLAREAR